MGIKKKSSQKSKASPRPRGLADALFTSTQQRVLGLLFGHPERKLFATELIRLAEAGRGAVQRELSALTEAGLINVETQGKQKYYQANKASPLFEELRRITLKTMGVADPLKDALRKHKAKIDLALVYGSVAKGTDKATSDIDVLIVANDLSLEDIYDAFAGTEKSLGRKISPTLYTSQEFKKRIESKNPFVEKILADDHVVLMGDKNVFANPR